MSSVVNMQTRSALAESGLLPHDPEDPRQARMEGTETATGGDTEVGGIASDRLRSIVDRVERLEEEKKALANDIKDIFAEAKSAGFDPKVLKRLIALRRLDPKDAEEQQSLLQLYARALGMDL